MGQRQKIALINHINEQDEEVLTRADAAERLYKFVAMVKKGARFDSSGDKDKPPLKDLGDTLVVKLRDLYEGDKELISEIVHRKFPVNQDGHIRLPCTQEFPGIMLETSNSGARDYLGHSLKFTKTVLLANKKLRNRMRDIFEGCLVIGHFPEIWTKDQISFLYKNKGDRKDATKYRPITIAPSLGKHLEKVVSSFLNFMDDTNHKNHAYTRNRSCISAVLDVQQKILLARLKANASLRDRSLGAPKKKILQFISADDIASAFESIGHGAITEAVKRSFACYEGLNLSGLLHDYLKLRKSTAVDRDSGETFEITRVFEDKTSSQGSLLSPKLWRIFDAIFSDLYEESLANLVAECDFIKCIDHLAYADDHLTIITIEVDADASPFQLASVIKSTLESTRKLLFKATTLIGCSINPDKSEGIGRSANI